MRKGRVRNRGATSLASVRMRLVLLLLLGGLLSACDGCQRHAHPEGRGVGMCGKCVRSAECAPRLNCVAGVCETAPPSCHVQIGL